MRFQKLKIVDAPPQALSLLKKNELGEIQLGTHWGRISNQKMETCLLLEETAAQLGGGGGVPRGPCGRGRQ